MQNPDLQPEVDVTDIIDTIQEQSIISLAISNESSSSSCFFEDEKEENFPIELPVPNDELNEFIVKM